MKSVSRKQGQDRGDSARPTQLNYLDDRNISAFFFQRIGIKMFLKSNLFPFYFLFGGCINFSIGINKLEHADLIFDRELFLP